MSDVAKTQIEFFVAKGEQNLGPWTVEQIAERIACADVSITDVYYDDAKMAWVSLMELEALREVLRRATATAQRAAPAAPPARPAPQMTKAAEPPMATVAQAPTPAPAQARPVSFTPNTKASTPDEQKKDQWFVQKGANRYGPMNYFGLVRALQEKSVYDFDFVWKEGMDNWMRLAEHPDFQPEAIRELSQRLAKEPSETGPFFQREFKRLPFSSEVIVHDDRSVWIGQSFEAGMGGSGLMIENSALHPGQVVRLHFAPCDGLPAFNALGEIVGKRFSREVRGAKSPVRYAVRFLKLDGTAEGQVREYFQAKSAS